MCGHRDQEMMTKHGVVTQNHRRWDCIDENNYVTLKYNVRLNSEFDNPYGTRCSPVLNLK